MLGRRTTLKHPRFRTAIAKIDHDIRLGIEADEYLSSAKYLWKNHLAPLLPNAPSYLPFLNPPPDNADLSTRLLGWMVDHEKPFVYDSLALVCKFAFNVVVTIRPFVMRFYKIP
ncbi:hypothetical protein N7509_014103 [Penicillium cosmopolitanum]|uniref:Uncharacterized protein n=1 Tax=Penicillium cosmopolitanum TaxID=1131564 RepID=A0A9W9V7U6_9EURO|nr:uncharacterized protein N7509_014103 [Penicillium cosmopolitanum]KAJ5369491.1 hypothetical protein N7509_014103 [Penicillium cosmopolitanum]